MDNCAHLDPAAVDKAELAVGHQALDQRLRALGLLRPPAREERLCMHAQSCKCILHRTKVENMQMQKTCR